MSETLIKFDPLQHLEISRETQAVLDTVRRASWGKNQKRLICI